MRSKRIDRRRAFGAALAAGLLLAGGVSARAEEAPTRAQVEQLQKQLAEMQKEMEALQQELAQSKAASPGMHRHMQGMQHHWQMMHDQACQMAPGTCPHHHMGDPPPAKP
jgi:outer membrane murein-binding lipoprotein Lpp